MATEANSILRGKSLPAKVLATARRFHEEYEYLAPSFGWETQEVSRVSWDDLPFKQKHLMVQVILNLESKGVIRLV